eukprot:1841319-Pyramimonas_sp.AAC.1
MMFDASDMSCNFKPSSSNHVVRSVYRALDTLTGFAWMSTFARGVVFLDDCSSSSCSGHIFSHGGLTVDVQYLALLFG